MRTLDESRKRWTETFKDGDDLTALQLALKSNGPLSPCEAGCRSVCWKIFLLFRDVPVTDRSRVLRAAREDYEALRKRHLQYIKHPELLAELTVDPLADDPESPWDAFRHDEVVRAEILQDVRRLPDDPFYHQEDIQTLILDILFIFCKQNPEAGGYRQGMHELLAPIVYVLSEDAVIEATEATAVSGDADSGLREMLDSRFVEHDAYALFSKVMSRAKAFYETSCAPAASMSLPSAAAADTSLPASVSELLPAISPSLVPTIVSGGPAIAAVEESTIVELSKEIHEGSLMKVDAELALHLKNIEILPQIFLIRWIRLLFGREFPFEQHLVLWDSIFAFDPKLNLVPLICVAMLLRIRWKLIDADYSVALQSLLKYQAPQAGPQTFVDDAVFLRDHLDSAGGAELILKYTGRAPARILSPLSSTSTASTRPSTPAAAFAAGLGSLRSRTLNMARSPLRSARPGTGSGDSLPVGHAEAASASSNAALSPSRFIQRREGVEALFQGARNVFERGEKLGINQAVRDAMGEIKRNVAQGLQEAKQAAAQRNAPGRTHGQLPAFGSPLFDSAAGSSSKRRLSYGETVRTLAEMEQRNRQLAAMLDETVVSLKAVAKQVAENPARTGPDQLDGASSESDRQQQRQQQWLEEVEIAAAKVQFVKVYLEDPSLVLPASEPEAESVEASTEVRAADPLPSRDTLVAATAADMPAADGTGQAADLSPPVEAVETALDETTAAPARAPAAAPPPKTPLMQTEAADADVSSIPPLTVSGDDEAGPAMEVGTNDNEQPTRDAAAPKPKAAPSTEPVASPPAEKNPEVHTVSARSTLAQSSFAWMLEPGDTPASVSNSANNAAAPNSNSTPATSGSAKKSGPSRPNPAGRTRHAFLFGDSVNQSPLGGADDPLGDSSRPTDQSRPTANCEVFDLEPLRRAGSKDNE